MLSRRQISVAGLFTLGWPAVSVGSEGSGTPAPALVVQTFLRAIVGRRRELGRFIELNWLAMDREGIDQGLFSHATLFDVVSAIENDEDRIDYIVEVGYLTAGGYGDVSARFDEIRSRHRMTPVEGLALPIWDAWSASGNCARSPRPSPETVT